MRWRGLRAALFNPKVYTVRDGLLSDVILSLAAAPNGRHLGGYSGRVESDSPRRGGFVYLGRWVARRLCAFAAGGCGRLVVDRHAARPDALDERTGRNAHGRPTRRRLVWAAIWWARWRAIRLEVCGWPRWPGFRGSTGSKITNYTTANGLSSDVVTALLPRERGNAAGRDAGPWLESVGRREVFRCNGEQARTRRASTPFSRTASNHLWFATANGIARCDCTMTADCSHWIEFGPADGLRSRETATNSHPRPGARAMDGCGLRRPRGWWR